MVRFSAVGDIMMGGKVAEAIVKYGAEYPFQYVHEILQSSDIIFGNLEAPLTNEIEKTIWDYSKIIDKPVIIDGKSYGNSIFCKAPPESIKGLIYSGFNVLSLANNHIMDYGEKGLLDTLAVLSKYKINSVGAGKNLTYTRKPVILQVNDIKIGVLAYCDVYVASEKRAGVAPTKYIIEDMKKVRDSVDILIISIHQGMDIVDYPLPNEIEFMHSIIDNGANLVLKHHPHVVNGIERYNNGVIVYSMGNFVFDYTIDPLWKDFSKTRDSMIFQCELSKNGVSNIKIIPVYLNDEFQPVPLDDNNGNYILERVKKLSFELENNIKNPDSIKLQQDYAKIQMTLAFHAIVDSIKKMRFNNILLIMGRIRPCHGKLLAKYIVTSVHRYIKI